MFRASCLLFFVFTGVLCSDDVPRRGFHDYADAVSVEEALPVRTSDPVQSRYEPIVSMGPFFLARVIEAPSWSPIVPYTKNATILYCSLLAFGFGILTGALLTLKLADRSKPETKQIGTTTVDPIETEDAGSQTEEAVEKLSKMDLSSTTESTIPVSSDRRSVADGEATMTVGSDPEIKKSHSLIVASSRRSTISKHHMRVSKDVSAMRKSVDELTESVHRMEPYLEMVAKTTGGIWYRLSQLTGMTYWLTERKSKSDAWLRATDNMTFGIAVMSISLMISSILFGSWQDWGSQCEATRYRWDARSVLARIWCYIADPCLFAAGWGVCYMMTKAVFGSGFLRRKQPMSSFLLWMTLIVAGNIYAFAVSMLGGSMGITLGIWLFYTMFLCHVLDTAKDQPSKGVNGLLYWKPVKADDWTDNASLTAAVAIFVFPVMAGTLPFWNVGLSLAIESAMNKTSGNLFDFFRDVSVHLSDFFMK